MVNVIKKEIDMEESLKKWLYSLVKQSLAT